MPALNYLLEPDEQGPLRLSLGQMVLWSLGLCYFGVVFVVPLYVVHPACHEPANSRDKDGARSSFGRS